MELAALRWYAMRACVEYIHVCPDDPAVVRFRQAIHDLGVVLDAD